MKTACIAALLAATANAADVQCTLDQWTALLPGEHQLRECRDCKAPAACAGPTHACGGFAPAVCLPTLCTDPNTNCWAGPAEPTASWLLDTSVWSDDQFPQWPNRVYAAERDAKVVDFARGVAQEVEIAGIDLEITGGAELDIGPLFCEAGETATSASTDTANGACARVCDITLDQYQNGAGACVPATKCTATQWEVHALEPAVDRVCHDHSPTCPDGKWESRPAGLHRDRVCRHHTVCNYNTHFESVSPSGKRDRVCTPLVHVCPAGQIEVSGHSATAQRVCRACPAGRFKESRGNERSCAACTEGTYSAAGAERCENCGAGEFQDEQGQSACKKCAKGQFQVLLPHGAHRCQDCPTGRYANSLGNSACTQCNFHCAAGLMHTGCGLVSPGSCTPCAKGTAKAFAGTQSCSDCASGTYADGGGFANCKACDAGKF